MKLALDSPEWLSFVSYAGTPAQTPKLISAWLETRESETLTTILWAQLSTQGSVSRAAAPALAHLAPHVPEMGGEQQRDVFLLTAMVLADRQSIDARWRADLEALGATVDRLATLQLVDPNTSPDAIPDLLQCIASIAGWYQGASLFELYRFEATELLVVCVHCTADLGLSFSPDSAITPGTPHGDIESRAFAIVERRSAIDDVRGEDLLRQLRLLFGTASCTECGQSYRVADAVS